MSLAIYYVWLRILNFIKYSFLSQVRKVHGPRSDISLNYESYAKGKLYHDYNILISTGIYISDLTKTIYPDLTNLNLGHDLATCPVWDAQNTCDYQLYDIN